MLSLGKPQQEYFSCISLLSFFHQLFTELLNSLCWSHFLCHWNTPVSPDVFSSHCYQVVVPHSLTPIPTLTLCETAWGQTLSTACTQTSPKVTETFTSGSKNPVPSALFHSHTITWDLPLLWHHRLISGLLWPLCGWNAIFCKRQEQIHFLCFF